MIPMPSQDAPTEPVRVPILPPPVRAVRSPMTLARKVAYWCAAISGVLAVLFVFTVEREDIRHPADAFGFVFIVVFGTVVNFAVFFLIAMLAVTIWRGLRRWLAWINRREIAP